MLNNSSHACHSHRVTACDGMDSDPIASCHSTCMLPRHSEEFVSLPMSMQIGEDYDKARFKSIQAVGEASTAVSSQVGLLVSQAQFLHSSV